MQGQRFNQPDFMGGQNQAAAVWDSDRSEWYSTQAMADNELARCENFHVVVDGELRKRKGYSKVNATEPTADTGATGIRGLARYYHNNAGTVTGYTVAGWGLNLWDWDATPAKITHNDTSRGVSGNDSFTLNSEWHFAQLANALYGANGANMPVRFGPNAGGTVYLRDYGCNPYSTSATELFTAAEGGAGNGPSAGVWYWIITFEYENSEESYAGVTSDGQATHNATRNCVGTNNIALSSIPVARAGYGCVARRIYRRKGSSQSVGFSPYRYVGRIADNTTTTFTDNILDANLGAEYLGSNYAGYNHATAPDWDDAVGAHIVTAHANRLFFSNTHTYPSRSFYSEEGLPGTRYPDNWFDVNRDDGDEIVQTISINNVLVYFKRNSIWVLTGTSPSDFALREVAQGIGCLSPRSVCPVGNEVTFYGKDGLYSFNGVTIRPLGTEIADSLRNTPATSTESTNSKGMVAVGFGERRLHVAVNDENRGLTDYGSSNLNNACYTRSLERGGWSRWMNRGTAEGVQWHCFTALTGPGEDSSVYAGAAREGFVFVLGGDSTYDDEPANNNIDIPAAIITKDWGFGDPEADKQFRRIWIHCRLGANQRMYLRYRRDGLKTWEPSSDLVAIPVRDANQPEYQIAEFVVPVRAKTLALYISNAPKGWIPTDGAIAATFNLYGITVEYRPKRAHIYPVKTIT